MAKKKKIIEWGIIQTLEQYIPKDSFYWKEGYGDAFKKEWKEQLEESQEFKHSEIKTIMGLTLEEIEWMKGYFIFHLIKIDPSIKYTETGR